MRSKTPLPAINGLFEKPTLKNILQSIIDNKGFDSKYVSEDDKKYLLENYASIDIFKGNVNEIAFIKKK